MQVLEFVTDRIRGSSDDTRRKAASAAKFYREISECVDRMADSFANHKMPTADCEQLAVHAERLEAVLIDLDIDDTGIKSMTESAVRAATGFPDSALGLFTLFGINAGSDIGAVPLAGSNTQWAGDERKGERELAVAVDNLKGVAGRIRALAIEFEAKS